MQRKCIDCGQRKPDSEYSKAGDYCFRYCKPCNSVRTKAKYHGMTPEERKAFNHKHRPKPEKLAARRKQYAEDPEHRAKMIDSSKRSYAKLRGKLFDGYGNKCVCCGESEVSFLEIDHVHGGGAKHFKSSNPAAIYREIIKQGFPPGYQLLCSNCNRGRQRNGGVCPHKSV